MSTQIQSLFGFIAFAAIAWLLSEHRSNVRLKVVLSGMSAQLVVGLVLLKIPVFKDFFLFLNRMVLFLEESTRAGTAFVFGYLGGGDLPFAEIYRFSVILLRFVAIYSLFDTLNIIFCSAIKGAGDTRYVMLVTTLLSVFILILPTYLAVEVFGYGLMVSWVLATVYFALLGLAFYIRFRGGKWKEMRVIEIEG